MNLTKIEKLQIIKNLQEVANPKYKNITKHELVMTAIAKAIYTDGSVDFIGTFLSKGNYNKSQADRVAGIVEHLDKTGCIEYVRFGVTKITNKITDYQI